MYSTVLFGDVTHLPAFACDIQSLYMTLQVCWHERDDQPGANAGVERGLTEEQR